MKKNLKKISTATLTLAGIGLGFGLSSQAGAQTRDFTLSKERARLVVLLHGVTPKIQEQPEQKIAMSGHARHYWSFEFIKGLQGRIEEDKMHVVTPTVTGAMRIRKTTKEDWVPSTSDTNPFDLAPICLVGGGLQPPSAIANDTEAIKDFIRLTTKRNGANATMVMVNTRDGSQHFMPQLGDTIDEIYRSYLAAFGDRDETDQPQIYLVGHSFGGVVARGILANPTLPDLFGNRLTPQQRQRCDYLRRRVVVVQTLSAPHEGTLIGDPASDVADWVAQKGFGPIYSILDKLDTWAPGKNMTETQLRQATKNALQTALNEFSGKRDCLEDLRRMNEYNEGILRPSTARRVPGGPLVPIYTASGRNPGGNYLDQDRGVFVLGGGSYNPISVIDYFAKGIGDATNAAALYAIEGIMHVEGYGLEGKKPWGTATNIEGDRVKSPWAGFGRATQRPLNAPWTPVLSRLGDVVSRGLKGDPYVFGEADGEWDNDGFLGWDSGNALNLNSPNFYRLFDRDLYGQQLPWDSDNHGSIKTNGGNGLWIHNEIIREAGPWISPQYRRRSVWGAEDFPVTPRNTITVDVKSIKDVANNLDGLTEADFRLRITVGGVSKVLELANNNGFVKDIDSYVFQNIVGTVIPVIIESVDRDLPGFKDPDDICVMSPSTGKSRIYLYIDTRTGRISGDAPGTLNSDITLRPLWVAPVFWSVDNKVESVVRFSVGSNIPY